MKALAIFALLMVAASADQYAVLVAGSNGYRNYRHQADMCHAYQLLITKGVPAENIITMSYNDVANSNSNPFPGKLFNKPTSGQGIDVNAGCVIDYKSSAVNKANYVAILTGGNTSGGNGRVLTSGPNDNVFLSFFDHGATDLIAFPSEYIYADELNDALNTMSSKQMFSKLTYYMEACESGSMFQNLNTPNVYAVSASNPSESSWAAYCGSDAYVNGVSIGSCLGDLFSVAWMEDSDANDITSETLQTQFQTVYSRTVAQSSPMQWGDTSFTSQTVSTFIGNGKSNSSFLRKLKSETFNQSSSVISSRDVKMNYLTSKFNENPSDEHFNGLNEEMNKIQHFAGKFDLVKSVFDLTGETGTTTDFECYRSVINGFENQCGKVTEKSMEHFKYFFELCQKDLDLQNTLVVIDSICA